MSFENLTNPANVIDHVVAAVKNSGYVELSNNNNSKANELNSLKVENSHHHIYSGCEINSSSITELCLESKFRNTENSNTKLDRDSCSNLKSQIEKLKAEWDNLLAVIKLLRQECESNQSTKEISSNKNPWIEVRGKKRNANQTQSQRHDQSTKTKKTDDSSCQVNNGKPKLTDAAGNQNVYNKNTPPGPINSQNDQLNGRPNQTPRKRHVSVIGDSMTKLINGRKLSKSCKVILHSFPGVTIEDL